ncbi:MAG: sodium:alanine symporter family protein [candidate division KSB1 bacterium]|nr:sodium:alanine symporter family protein [candidate division KSB1 bacterium]MDZ7336387.1 sodium:alanine symporter family protein [candidate division KSB1 bacterium]MDZ7357406.1 sodium:alanine symporter family protein [candidate division KSB1 bacterium]MDZ7377094.1 sodium:alanine symporter family protein [candidate division KSB1 bacterium]MDZ7401696.1 sodium:alanine symporter family protein [candidate division KSB1 bacterium]
MQGLEQLLSKISNWVWGIPLLVLLFGTHLFLTIRLRFIQRYIGKAIKLSFRRQTEGAGDVSHFGALTTALAATIGTGNIVGVATAIAAGGPGAVLWTWLTGVFGIATKYAEAVLSVKYRITTPSGLMAGGPMYVLERGLKMKWLGIIFAALTAVTAFGIGNMVQANSIASMVTETVKGSLWITTRFPELIQYLPWITGVFMTSLTAIVILGGIKSIARVCEGLVPFMAVFYVMGCVILLIMGASTIPHTIKLILESAFTGHAALGGFLGAGVREAIRYGIARGLFSNESGLGSAPIVAAAAQTKNPVRQALVSSTGTFWDTVVVCAMTGLVLVNSNEWLKGLSGAALTKAAFSDIPVIGPIVLTIGLLTFVFSTILGWSYYGEKAAEYLFGTRIILPYRLVWVVMVMVGSVATMPAVWSFADIANGLMAIPNLISLLLLSGVIVAETRKFLWSDRLDEVGD